MNRQRRHTRFRLDLATLDGNMLLTENAEILDISAGGASLRTDRALTIGNKYLILCTENDQGFGVRGVVVQSEAAAGEGPEQYTAHIRFDEGQARKIAGLLESVAEKRSKDGPIEEDKRHDIRFRMTIPLESILSHTARFRVKTMSLSGMLIESNQPLEKNSMIPMELSLHGGIQLAFIGRVASCLMADGNGHANFDIGVEFMDLTETGKVMLNRFIESLNAAKHGPAVSSTSDMLP